VKNPATRRDVGLGVLDRQEIAGGGDLAPGLPERAGQRLDLAGLRLAAQAADPVGEYPRRRGVESGPDRRTDLRRYLRRLRVDDVVAQRLTQRHRVVERGHAVGVTRRPVGGAGGEGDAQPPGVGADLVAEPPGRRGRPVGVAQRGPGRRVQQRGAVAH
jgi:hypothetical protein